MSTHRIELVTSQAYRYHADADRLSHGGGGANVEVEVSLGILGRIGAAPDPRRQGTQELLDWLLRNGRREKLCGEVARISGAPHALVEDVFQGS